jgi:ribosomal protein S13
MSDFSLKILNNKNLKFNFRNTRRKSFGWGLSSAFKCSFFAGVGTKLSDRFFFNSCVDNFSILEISLVSFFKLNKPTSRIYFLRSFLRLFFHFLLGRLSLEADLIRSLKFSVNKLRHLRRYRGIRSFYLLPGRGQRTKTNASSRKIAAKKKKAKNYRKQGMISITGKKYPLTKYRIDSMFDYKSEGAKLVFSSSAQSDSLNFQIESFLTSPDILRPITTNFNLIKILKEKLTEIISLNISPSFELSNVFFLKQLSMLYNKESRKFSIKTKKKHIFKFIKYINFFEGKKNKSNLNLYLFFFFKSKKLI